MNKPIEKVLALLKSAFNERVARMNSEEGRAAARRMSKATAEEIGAAFQGRKR